MWLEFFDLKKKKVTIIYNGSFHLVIHDNASWLVCMQHLGYGKLQTRSASCEEGL